MIKTVMVCNNCGEQRREANHWFAAHVLLDGALIVAVEARSAPPGLGDPDAHLCGENCAAIWLSKQLTEVKRAYAQKAQPA